MHRSPVGLEFGKVLRFETCGRKNPGKRTGGCGKSGVARAPAGGLPSLGGTYPMLRRGEPGHMTGWQGKVVLLNNQQSVRKCTGRGL